MTSFQKQHGPFTTRFVLSEYSHKTPNSAWSCNLLIFTYIADTSKICVTVVFYWTVVLGEMRLFFVNKTYTVTISIRIFHLANSGITWRLPRWLLQGKDMKLNIKLKLSLITLKIISQNTYSALQGGQWAPGYMLSRDTERAMYMALFTQSAC